MDVPAAIRSFWQAFEASAGRSAAAHFYEAFHFDDNEPSANQLADLVLAGTKRATAGLVWSFEAANMPLPKQGKLSVVTNWSGIPLCVIETQFVEVVPFDQVSQEFAATEGEGDGSLRYWRDGHWAYFSRECARIGRQPDLRMPVMCERFAVIYRAPR